MDKSIAEYQFSFFNKNRALVFVTLIMISALYSCQKKQQKIKLNGFTKGLNGYVIGIQLNDSTIASENVINDRFTITTMLPRKDFYTLKLWSSNGSGSSQTFPVYLSGGEYSVRTDSASVDKYPAIKSNSPIQNDLTKYYLIKEKNTAAFERKYGLAKKDYDDNFLNSEGEAFDKLAVNFGEAESNLSKSIDYSKKEFITNNRESIVSAYFLTNSFPDMEYQPATYLNLFDALSDDVKESIYGSRVKGLLNKYNKAAVNTLLPDISGVTTDGNTFNKDALKGKLTLIMFWMSSNKDSRNDIKQLADLYKELHPKGLEIVGVAFDSSKERWQEYVSGNHFPGIQIYDSEGIKSVNIERFGNTNLPYYFLVGPDLNIIERNPPIESIPIYHKDYLAQQKTVIAQ